MQIRTGTPADLEALAALEAACFPVAEAASKESLEKRLAVYPDHFWLLEEDGKIVAMVNGFVTDDPVLRDEMYAQAQMHNESGAWQMIFGVDTLPAYRKRGFAGALLNRVLEDARHQGRKGCVLTCKAELVHYYEKFGFRNEGVSQSVHGGAVWYDMRVSF